MKQTATKIIKDLEQDGWEVMEFGFLNGYFMKLRRNGEALYIEVDTEEAICSMMELICQGCGINKDIVSTIGEFCPRCGNLWIYKKEILDGTKNSNNICTEKP